MGSGTKRGPSSYWSKETEGMNNDYDVIVIGLGAMGSAAAEFDPLSRTDQS